MKCLKHAFNILKVTDELFKYAFNIHSITDGIYSINHGGLQADLMGGSGGAEPPR